MKTKLLLCVLCISTFLRAQTTAIPDSNFEQALIDLGHDDVIDGSVLTANINTVAELIVDNKSISSLTGIEDFIALTNLNCSNNSISNIDINNNAALNVLNCSNNNLSNLDISNNNLLVNLFCFDNPITSLDVSNNPVLIILNCANTLISSLDVSNKLNLDILVCSDNSILTTLNAKGANTLSTVVATNCPNLSCINVDDASAANANVGIYTGWTEDASAIYSEHCFETNIPDDNFEQALIDLGYDSVLDDYVPTENINTITTLDVSSKSISDLTGIEDFIALEDLLCIGNQISNVDVSANTALVSLNIQNNNLTSLSVSNNAALATLICSNNPLLMNLDVSNNPALAVLLCFNNQLSSLDVSSNPMLFSLSCYANQLTELYLNNNPMLTQVLCFNNVLTSFDIRNGNNDLINVFNANNNPDLFCIQLDNAANASAGIGSYNSWLKDNTASYEEHCLDTFVPDDNFEQALIDLGYDSGVLDDYIPTRNINTIIALDVETLSINDLTGIEAFTALEDLRIRNNTITSLDLSNNTNLTALRGDDNALTSLNLKSGNNAALTFMRVENNNLACIQVDDEASANAGTGPYGSWRVDTGVAYSENCSGCPEMDIQGNGNSILSGDTTPSSMDDTDFGIVAFGSFAEKTFTIENTQNVNLNLTGTPIIEVANSTDFSITAEPNIIVSANGGITTFTVRYTPSQVGTINTATLSIISDDCDESPYSFNITGESDNSLNTPQDELLQHQLLVYPNPSNGKFKLKYDGPKTIERMKLYDITGKMIVRFETTSSSHQKEIDLSFLPKGIYFLRVNTHISIITKKIIIN